MKQPCMSICRDINLMGAVEHERSLRGTQGVAKYFSDFSSALQLPECLQHSCCKLSTNQSKRYILDIL
jgi:hypothetical protein